MTEQEKELVEKIHKVNYGLLDELDRVCRLHGIRYYLAYGGLLGAVRYGDFIPWDDDVDVVMFYSDYKELRRVRHELKEPYRFVEPEDYGEKSYDMVPRINDSSVRILTDSSSTARFYESGLRDYAALDIFLLGDVPAGFKGIMHKVRLAALYGILDTYRDPNGSKKTGLMKAAQSVLHVAGRFTNAQAVRRKFWREYDRYSGQKDRSGKAAVKNGSLGAMNTSFPADIFEPAGEINMKGHVYTVPGRYKEMLRICYGDDYMTPPPENERRPKSIYR